MAAGVNPNLEKRKREKEQAHRGATLGRLWEYYLQNHAKPKKRSWQEDEKRYKRDLEAVGKSLVGRRHPRRP